MLDPQFDQEFREFCGGHICGVDVYAVFFTPGKKNGYQYADCSGGHYRSGAYGAG